MRYALLMSRCNILFSDNEEIAPFVWSSHSDWTAERW